MEYSHSDIVFCLTYYCFSYSLELTIFSFLHINSSSFILHIFATSLFKILKQWQRQAIRQRTGETLRKIITPAVFNVYYKFKIFCNAIMFY